MGDKNPKAQAKSKKQATAVKTAERAEHDRRHAPPAPAAAPARPGKKDPAAR